MSWDVLWCHGPGECPGVYCGLTSWGGGVLGVQGGVTVLWSVLWMSWDVLWCHGLVGCPGDVLGCAVVSRSWGVSWGVAWDVLGCTVVSRPGGVSRVVSRSCGVSWGCPGMCCGVTVLWGVLGMSWDVLWCHGLGSVLGYSLGCPGMSWDVLGCTVVSRPGGCPGWCHGPVYIRCGGVLGRIYQ